jgi:hypothetical protein
MSVNLNNSSFLDLIQQQLAAQASNGNVTLDQALETTVGGVKLKDLADVKSALTGLAVDGQLPLETVLACVNSRYDTAGGGLVVKGTGTPLDAKGMDLSGLSGLAQLMLLLINNASEQRKTGQEVRFAQSEAIQNKLMDAAEDMRKGAIVAMALGVAAGAVSIAGGVAGLASSVNAASKAGDLTSKAGDLTKMAGDFSQEATLLADSAENLGRQGANAAQSAAVTAKISGNFAKEAANLTQNAANLTKNADQILARAATQSQAFMSVGGGLSTIFSSVGQGVQGIMNADAKEKEAEAEKMRALRDAEGDTIAALKDFIQATINLVQTLLDKETEAMTRIMV